MASSVSVIASSQPHHQSHMDRLDAARALLGVSPASSSAETSPPNRSKLSVSFGSPITARTFQQTTAQQSQEPPRLPLEAAAKVTFETPLPEPPTFRLTPPAVAVISNGLDALAALASSEQATWDQHQPQQQPQVTSALSSSSSDDDSEVMPPPPPRATGRRRSVSNPEGMEKWANTRPSRRHFVLPASILEEELAEASAAMEAHERKNSMDEEEEEEEEQPEESHSSSVDNAAPISGLMSEEEQANLSPEELLKRARSRLLEDLSEGNLAGEKGVLTLPHSLSKYKEVRTDIEPKWKIPSLFVSLCSILTRQVYNKNGRIGIYTPAERAAIIARFNHKRSRRVWNKKIRYNCRKNLADRRMRVKGRFVKRSTEQQAKVEEEPTPPSNNNNDEDMPDVTDPEAGFCPTEDQPYRRTRRHTIT